MSHEILPRYEIRQSYQWNYDHAPDPIDSDQVSVVGEYQICGLPIESPLAVAAGPLLNGRWVLYYASLGFDVLTYKTVRTEYRDCYPMPNLLPVPDHPLHSSSESLTAESQMAGSWAISFGMPSKLPDIWQADVEWTRRQLDPQKRLAVSVVATVQPDWTLQEVAKDYARCARWAVDAGADLIEINLSCPNVSTCDGQLYQQPEDARVVAEAVKEAISETPLLAKIGFVPDDTRALALLSELADSVDAMIMVNGISARILDAEGASCFGGEYRGVGGLAIFDRCVDQVSRFRKLVSEHQFPTEIVGCGGVATADDVLAMLDAGALAVQIATAAMIDPALGLTLRRELNRRRTGCESRNNRSS